MNNYDSFEAIAQDAVRILLSIIDGLRQNEDPEAKLTARILAVQAEELCDRSIALGGI